VDAEVEADDEDLEGKNFKCRFGSLGGFRRLGEDEEAEEEKGREDSD